MKTPKTKIKPVTAKAWSGVWLDGNLGWWLSEFVHPHGSNGTNTALREQGYKFPLTFYRVKVTITPVFDKLGRPIKKTIKPKSA